MRFGNPTAGTYLADLTELRLHHEAMTAAIAANQAEIAAMQAAQDAVAAFRQAADARHAAAERLRQLEAQLALPD